ncbi:sulfurtransferase TusA family protein [bacterium]|mgnify:CR=1 FL=1|nr:sulfurtransferase TusA family protein [bacterium]
MDWTDRHAVAPDASFDGGDLDCGNGLLLLIRRHIDPLDAGQVLEVRSTDASVEEDLPAWCRLTGNALVSRTKAGAVRSYLVRKGGRARAAEPRGRDGLPAVPVVPEPLSPAPPSDFRAPPFAVMGVGSWPRPGWLLRSLHDRLSGRLPDDEFQRHADDAVRLAVAAQERAGADVVTDGEQRRDGYASFVGGRLDNCQLVPLTDLLPYVTRPDHFAEELRALDVPAEQVRHPAVFGKITRSRPLAVHELERARRFTGRPIKVALPGPYLLARTMWLECVADKAYPTREALAADVVAALRQEAEALLAAGAALVQFDEPVLTEVVFARKTAGRSFMCGALGERRDPDEELAFAGELLGAVLAGLPKGRLALHVCRGNWSRDESVALSGPYTPLVPLLKTLPVGTFFLEMATPRAGDLEPLAGLPADCRVGVGVVNQKLDRVEPVEEVVAKAEAAARLLGPERVLLNPDCGFATFADNPLASAAVAEAKLAAVAEAARRLRSKYGVG